MDMTGFSERDRRRRRSGGSGRGEVEEAEEVEEESAENHSESPGTVNGGRRGAFDQDGSSTDGFNEGGEEEK